MTPLYFSYHENIFFYKHPFWYKFNDNGIQQCLSECNMDEYDDIAKCVQYNNSLICLTCNGELLEIYYYRNYILVHKLSNLKFTKMVKLINVYVIINNVSYVVYRKNYSRNSEIIKLKWLLSDSEVQDFDISNDEFIIQNNHYYITLTYYFLHNKNFEVLLSPYSNSECHAHYFTLRLTKYFNGNIKCPDEISLYQDYYIILHDDIIERLNYLSKSRIKKNLYFVISYTYLMYINKNDLLIAENDESSLIISHELLPKRNIKSANF